MTETHTIASFGYWVRRQRKALDLTQADLARAVGCARVTVSKIERDERRPSRQMAELLAQHLAVPSDEHERFLAAARGQRSAARLALPAQPQALRAARTQLTPRAPMVGRRHEWRQLQDAWRFAQRGQAQCLLLWGESGIGKTRLAEELIDLVQKQGQSWAASRSFALEGVLTYAPIAEWLRSPAVRPSLDAFDDLWRIELARLLPELLRNRPELPAPEVMTEDWQQQRFFQAIVQAIQAAPTPLFLHLDDMQWTEPETLALLQFLLHGVRKHPLLLVGGIRTEDAGVNQALAAFIAAARHANQLRELHLGPLSLEEVETLAAQTAGEAITPEQASRLYTASEGHPLYLIEVVRSGFTEAHATVAADEQNGSNRIGVPSMPARIRKLLSARLDQLSPSTRDVANMAAVVGRTFSYAILQAAVTHDEMALVDALDELLQQRIIREQGSDCYDFSHDRVREVTYQEINQARRRLYHRQVATALETVQGDDLDDVAGELAAHFAQAGDEAAAYRYYRLSATLAIAQHALPHAEAMLDAALELAPEDPVERIRLLHDRNRVFGQSMESDHWRNNLDAMQELLESLDPLPLELQLVYLLDRSRYFDVLGYGEQGVETSKAAIAVAEQLDDQHALAHAHDLLASNYWKAGMMTEASRAFETTARHAHRIGDRRLEAKMLIAQARNGAFTDMPSAQLGRLLAQAFELAEAIDDKELMVDSLGKLGYWRIGLGMGRFELTERDLRRAIALAKESGQGTEIIIRQGNLGWLLTNMGDYRRALTALDASQTEVNESSAAWLHWINVARRGTVWLEMGCLDAAGRFYREASAKLQQYGARHFDAQVQCDLAWLHLLSRRYQEAEFTLEHVLGVTEQTGDLRLRARACTRLGYVLEATQYPQEALEKYRAGFELHRSMEQHFYAMNARAGLARLAITQGDNDAALAHVTAIWETIGGKEVDATIETAHMLRTCHTIFAEHQDPRADAVLAMAWEQLQRRAA
ncbi:MAG: AAA family ATPase, partial [Caldilineaceae bacterium]|nr:AAA family ATPase [Caldilineaceae bacterium]